METCTNIAALLLFHALWLILWIFFCRGSRFQIFFLLFSKKATPYKGTMAEGEKEQKPLPRTFCSFCCILISFKEEEGGGENDFPFLYSENLWDLGARRELFQSYRTDLTVILDSKVLLDREADFFCLFLRSDNLIAWKEHVVF